MNIIVYILMFIFGSIGAAFEGDYSGLEAIGKFIFYAVIIIGVMLITVYAPIIPIIVTIAVIIIAIASR